MSEEKSKAPGFAGYDKAGHFVHYCACGKWGAFGVDVSLCAGKFGTWYCAEHRPKADQPPPPGGAPPAVPPPPIGGPV